MSIKGENMKTRDKLHSIAGIRWKKLDKWKCEKDMQWEEINKKMHGEKLFKMV